MQDVLILLTSWTHVLLAPYTKVEESFNLHATHDVLFYGVSPNALHNYDHFTFPGAVPRTFIGSILLAWLSTPFIWLSSLIRGVDPNKLEMQIIIRLVLSTLTSLSLIFLRHTVSRRFGKRTALFFTLLTCSQFHVPFWMGRTVPNMFAFGPVTIALALLISPSPKRTSWAFTLLTLSATIFRAELVLLLAPLALHSLLTRQITFGRLVKVGLAAGMLSIGLTILSDTYLWQTPHPLWPELYGIYFNVLQGKSAEWGTSPPHTYLTTHIPKLLLSSLPLALLALFIDPRIRGVLWPTMAFIGAMSLLGHKEWRFVAYVVPVWNVAGARGCVWMISRRKGTLLGRLSLLLVPLLILTNFLITTLLTTASIANYPGGHALAFLHSLHPRSLHTTTQQAPHVHICNLAAQTSASLFTQINSPPSLPSSPLDLKERNKWWMNNKTENLSLEYLTSKEAGFTHLITESNFTVDTTTASEWKLAGVINGFERWSVDWALLTGKGRKGELLTRPWGVLEMVQVEKLWVYEPQVLREYTID